MSDRAVASSPLFPSNNTSIINNGTITGFVQLVGGNNSIVNNGLFNLRHFADTNGDGVRDTLRVAIADLGTGPNNSFTNNGTLALPRSDRRHRRWTARGSISRSGTPTTQWRSAGRCRAT